LLRRRSPVQSDADKADHQGHRQLERNHQAGIDTQQRRKTFCQDCREQHGQPPQQSGVAVFQSATGHLQLPEPDDAAAGAAAFADLQWCDAEPG